MSKKRSRVSIVDKLINSLNIGEEIKITGSASYWRNRQASFHRENPEKRIEIAKQNGNFYAIRKSDLAIRNDFTIENLQKWK